MRNISNKTQSSPEGLKTLVIAISPGTNTTRENSARSEYLEERQNGSESTRPNTAVAVLCINYEKCFISDISAQIRLRIVTTEGAFFCSYCQTSQSSCTLSGSCSGACLRTGGAGLHQFPFQKI